ncbi:MAG: S8 family serine peptidase [Paenibacillaceae bacterium]
MKQQLAKCFIGLVLIAASLSMFNSQAVQAASQQTPPVTVAVVDTGIDLQHTELKNYLVSGSNLVQANSAPLDDNGHGTNVAGVIIDTALKYSISSGIAWTPRIMPIKALDVEGTGDEELLGKGINYAVDHGARIVLLSLGLNKFSTYLSEIVENAEAHGVLLIAASGNEGEAVKYPAAYATVLAVGGVTANHIVELDSNYGPELDLAAPWNVYTTAKGGGYERQEGTSMAAPQVAAACALLWSKFPEMTPAQIRNMLRQTAEGIGAKGWDEQSGYGMLRIDRVLAEKPLDDIYEPNGRADTAKILPLGKKSYAVLANGKDIDWFIIDAPYKGSMQMNIQSDSPNADAIEMIYYKKPTDTGKVYKAIASKEVSFQVVKGRNYLRFRSSKVNVNTSIKYEMYPQFFMSPDPFEDNDSKFKAYVFPARSQVITGNFHQSLDQDWFMFPVTEAGTLRLKLSVDTSRIDSVLRIEKAGEESILIDQKGDGQTETTLPMEVTPGQYYLWFSNVKDYSFPIVGEYMLQIDYDKHVMDPNEPNDRSYQAAGMQADLPYEGILDEDTDVDWFSFNVDNESLVHLELSHIPLDRKIYFSLQNYALKPVKNLENAMGSTTSSLDIKLARGEYYIELRADHSFQNQLYQLQMNTSPIVSGFADIYKHWAKDSIVKLADLKFINGYGNYKFLPDRTITRAEAVAIINQAFGWTGQEMAPFNDVFNKDWFAAAVANGSKVKVVTGFPDGSFKPNQPLTRMEMVALLAKAKGSKPASLSKDSFSDIHEGYWGLDLLRGMKKMGWITGYKDGSFQPERPATRAEFTELLVKIKKY